MANKLGFTVVLTSDWEQRDHIRRYKVVLDKTEYELISGPAITPFKAELKFYAWTARGAVRLGKKLVKRQTYWGAVNKPAPEPDAKKKARLAKALARETLVDNS